MHVGVDHRRQVAEAQYGTGNVLVALVRHVGAGLLARHGRIVGIVELRSKRLVMVGQARREQSEAAADVHAGRIALGVGRGVIGESGSLIHAHALAHRHIGDRRHVVLDRSDQADRVGMIGHDQNERVVTPCARPIAGELHRVVEHDGVVDRALHVQEVGVLVDHARLHHQEETGFVPCEHLQRCAHLLGQARLLRKFSDGAAFENLAIESAVHVAEREQPEKFGRLRIVGKRRHFGTGRSQAVARVAKLSDEVGVIPALAAFHGLRQEVRAATAHDDVGLGGEELLHDAVVFAAPAHVGHHRGGGGILDLGIGDDADRHPMSALDQTGDGLDLGIVERVEGAIGIDPHGVDRRLVAGRIGAGGIGRVGNDRIAARGRNQRHMRHVVDGEFAARLALGDALREHARRHAVGERHAVADEQDDVLRPARPAVIDVPLKFTGIGPVPDAQPINAGLCE